MKKIEQLKKKIFTQKLEGIGAGIFQKRYKDVLIQEIGTKHGVYALYDKKEKLYYVGRASNISRRLKDHFNDRHAGKWDRFSIYFTKKEQYIYGIEDALVSIAQPKGNTNQPLRIDNKMKSRIKKAMRKIDKEQRERLIGESNSDKYKNNLKIKNKKKSKNNNPTCKNPFGRDKKLKTTYKGKIYRAIWLKSSQIKYKNKIYNSPTRVAKIASGRKAVNGRAFWCIQDSKGDWARLKDCI